jgi:D-sedoheptulose 7-phosphate isomerase
MKNPSMTRILSHFEESARLANELLGNAAFLESMEKGAAVLIDALRQDAKILSCGNGGSMCDAMHFAEELSGRYRDDRPPLAALALSDASAMTCVGNDYGFDQVFARQINALGRPGDVLLAISTSGNSGNILEACRAAKAVGMQVVSLTGNGGGTLRTMSDVDVCVPWSGYADRIQEVHIRCIHSWIDAMEQALSQG